MTLKKFSHCVSETTDSFIKVEERGKKLVINNTDRRRFQKVRVDDCLTKQETGADWLIVLPGQGEVVVELKGKDVPHAIKQIRATLELWKSFPESSNSLAAVVVASNVRPAVSTELLRAKNEFMEKFSSTLHVFNGGATCEFEPLFNARGPLKKNQHPNAHAHPHLHRR
jgi:hypothetical protein